MEFNEQIEWIENKIEQLKKGKEKSEEMATKYREEDEDSELVSMVDNSVKTIQQDINALHGILHGYKRAHKSEVNASWDNNPDRMGR